MDLAAQRQDRAITGASVGIGFAVAEGLAAEAANIVLAACGGERISAEATRVANVQGCGPMRSPATSQRHRLRRTHQALLV